MTTIATAPAAPLKHSPRGTAALYDLCIRLGERRGMAARRAGVLARAEGRVLEIGAGTGRNLPHYPEALERLVITEPDAEMIRRMRKRAAAQRPGAELTQAAADALPFEDDAFDMVVSTMVLCTVPDVDAALRELRRVLRPGGRLLFIEHVRADDARHARKQDRWFRPWRIWGDGCRCNQPTLELLARHFDVEPVERDAWRGMPRIVQPLVLGAAVAA